MGSTDNDIIDLASDELELFRLRGVIIAIWTIALVAVCLRFLARRLSNAGLWYDDWLMIPATVSISPMIMSSTTPLVQEDDSSSCIYQLVATALCFISATWSRFPEVTWNVVRRV